MADALWHKEAVIYQLHVRTFADSNGDGVGDFRGLIDRLDYIVQLGVNCLWLLPFYESPLRDDGYDIAHYTRIHPAYGTMADVDAFLDAAHQRGLRVITELVINHTSDQHPWFQAARRAPAGSPERDVYVWSDTPDRYAQARIIFSDAESSNWTWDAEARAYYWHRFFHHQPDLNFDNPSVQQAVLGVMRFWLDKGVDGLRLDAVAHLYEREGTSCDSLPETHALLQWMRADLDARYANRILIAEANQPPAALRAYFGAGDECHMAFHFPLVAPLFAAFADGVAAPIVEAIEQNADIPATCQWAMYLRNHDDMSFAALGPEETARLLAVYAPDARMQLHGGIRRRLASLLDHDQRRIELAHALLFSLPGAPILYYGDEIGMSERLDLPDRDGLRTPMQWDAGAHGGFTTAPAATIPVNQDPVYGAGRINVAAQWHDPSSLLRRLAAMLRMRRDHRAFGRGSITYLATGSPAVLACVRACPDDAVVLLANLSDTPQRATLTLPGAAAWSLLTIDNASPPSTRGIVQCELPAYSWQWWGQVLNS